MTKVLPLCVLLLCTSVFTQTHRQPPNFVSEPSCIAIPIVAPDVQPWQPNTVYANGEHVQMILLS